MDAPIREHQAHAHKAQHVLKMLDVIRTVSQAIATTPTMPMVVMEFAYDLYVDVAHQKTELELLDHSDESLALASLCRACFIAQLHYDVDEVAAALNGLVTERALSRAYAVASGKIPFKRRQLTTDGHSSRLCDSLKMRGLPTPVALDPALVAFVARMAMALGVVCRPKTVTIVAASCRLVASFGDGDVSQNAIAAACADAELPINRSNLTKAIRDMDSYAGVFRTLWASKRQDYLRNLQAAQSYFAASAKKQKSRAFVAVDDNNITKAEAVTFLSLKKLTPTSHSCGEKRRRLPDSTPRTKIQESENGATTPSSMVEAEPMSSAHAARHHTVPVRSLYTVDELLFKTQRTRKMLVLIRKAAQLVVTTPKMPDVVVEIAYDLYVDVAHQKTKLALIDHSDESLALASLCRACFIAQLHFDVDEVAAASNGLVTERALSRAYAVASGKIPFKQRQHTTDELARRVCGSLKLPVLSTPMALNPAMVSFVARMAMALDMVWRPKMVAIVGASCRLVAFLTEGNVSEPAIVAACGHAKLPIKAADLKSTFCGINSHVGVLNSAWADEFQ